MNWLHRKIMRWGFLMCYSTQVYHFKRLPLFNSPMRSQEAKGVTLSLWLILIIQILHCLYNIKQASVKALSSLIFSSYLYIILNLNVKIFSWLRAKTLEDSTKFIQNFLNFFSNIGVSSQDHLSSFSHSPGGEFKILRVLRLRQSEGA